MLTLLLPMHWGSTHLTTGLLEERNSCSTVTAGVSSRLVTLGMLQMARAASKMTISCLWRRQDSRKSKKGRCSPASPVPDSEITWATKRTSRHCARGDLQSDKRI